MSLKTLKDRSRQFKVTAPYPAWVSPKNSTLKAYKFINELKQERLEYIAKHNQPKDYKKKSLYLINASEVARNIGIATTTLISTSAYSAELKKYLEEVNETLVQAKNIKLSTHQRTRSRGLQQRKKDDIKQELQRTKNELIILKRRNVHEQTERLLSALPLPIKRKLGLDV